MKIVYLTDVNLDKTSGVLNKINDQIDVWCREGNEVHFISIASNWTNQKRILLTATVSTVTIVKNKLCYILLKEGAKYGILNRTVNFLSVRKKIKELSPDIIYLREMIPFPFMYRIFRGFKTVLEANTILEEELRLYNKISLYLYRKFSPKLYDVMAGFIGVTEEITSYFLKYQKPSITISNGINSSTLLPFKKKVKLNRKTVNLIFVGSPNQAWHGVDKFLEMARLLPNFEFHLVGPTIESELKNFHVHGYLDKNTLMEVYQNVDIAVGSLALFRNNMNEACPLKVREYIALGLPVIIGYRDHDLKNKEYVLQLSNTENSIVKNLNDINKFIIDYKNYIINDTEIRKTVDVTCKEVERIRFFNCL